MATIKQQAIALLSRFGWVETSYPGKYHHPTKCREEYIYLGKGYSIRYGKSKATSHPIPLDRLKRMLDHVNTLPDTQPTPIERNPVTVLRRELHNRIGQLDETQCRELLARLDSCRP